MKHSYQFKVTPLDRMACYKPSNYSPYFVQVIALSIAEAEQRLSKSLQGLATFEFQQIVQRDNYELHTLLRTISREG